MYKKTLAFALSTTLIFCTSYSAIATPEATLQESKAKYQQLNNDILQVNTKLSEINNELSSLNQQLEINKEKIDSTQNEIAYAENQISIVTDEIEETQEVLGKRMRGMYKSGKTQNNLSYLITSENFSDFISRVTTLNKVMTLDKQLIDDLNTKTNELNKNIENLNAQKNNLEDLKKSTEDNIQERNTLQSEYEDQLNELNNQKLAVTAIIETNEATLVSHPISVINSSSSSDTDIQNAINSLKALLPQLSSSNVISNVNQAIEKGTSKITPTPEINLGGNGEYKATYSMVATAYSGHTITAMGIRPVRDPNGLSSIAVDPNVIPLGTKVYIPGYGYAMACDTGGAIKGNKIDLFMNSSSECYAWGRRTVTLHVVAYPGEW